ncbi:MMPL family transporter [Streptomyces sp. NPDC001523]|uniref:MMPL family transporter n=1 Tax=Streptomyces sp. NPDC001523 TaxID=3154383 RepID=UPI00332EAA22
MPDRRLWTVGLWPVVVLVLWLLAGGLAGPYGVRLGEVVDAGQSAAGPRTAESAMAAAELRGLGAPGSLPLVVVWEGRSSADVKRAAVRVGPSMAMLNDRRVLVGAEPATVSADGSALVMVLQLRSDLGDLLPAAVEEARRAAQLVPGMLVHLAGPAAAQSDLQRVFDTIDGRLLVVTMAAVLLILFLVYRSVVLPLVVAASALLALSLACACLYFLAGSGWVAIDGQVQGILFVLVIGATTDYGLLFTARYREELEQGAVSAVALRAAWRRSAPPIAASAATVALALAALLLSGLPGNRALGPAGALAMGCSLLAALTFLPAVLMMCGRTAFWPSLPNRSKSRPARLWMRIAALVTRSPRGVWAGTLAVVLAAAAFAPLLGAHGVPLDRSLPATALSVTGQAALERHFPAGTGSPAIVLTDPASSRRIQLALSGTAGVAGAVVVPPPGGGSLAATTRGQVVVTLADVPDGRAAQQTIGRIRAVARETAGPGTYVGGQSAQILDMQEAAAGDRVRVFPVVMAVILLVLVGLLRCLLMPVILIAAVVLTFLAALGISSVVLLVTIGSAETEPTIVLYAFVFLVALGADYNIFLMHRVREEALRHGTRLGGTSGLVSTGAVISSAGIVLATTFTALTIMPLLYLVHIGVIVAIGVLLDTLLIRSFLVPALIEEIGPAIWWPRALPSDSPDAAAEVIPPRGAAAVSRSVPRN